MPGAPAVSEQRGVKTFQEIASDSRNPSRLSESIQHKRQEVHLQSLLSLTASSGQSPLTPGPRDASTPVGRTHWGPSRRMISANSWPCSCIILPTA
eukprot:768426-Hanusia_phi.AAC.3